MSLLWQTGGFGTTGPPTDFYSYNNDSGIWSTFSGWPDSGNVTLNAAMRQQGAFDGSYWYIIGPDLKLYRMNGTTRVWSGALNGGVAPISGAPNTASWQMCCDGRFVYVLFNGSDFRRYDSVADSFTVLSTPPNGTVPTPAHCFLAYDGVNTIYARGTDSGTTRQVLAYTISTATWSGLTTFVQIDTLDWSGAVCLQGKLWVFLHEAPGGAYHPWAYDPVGVTWTAKTSQSTSAAMEASVPYGVDTDATVRFWQPGTSWGYNVGTDAWTAAAAPPVDFSGKQGANWAITRIFAPQYSLFAADGVTPLVGIDALGTLVIGQVDQLEIQAQAAIARPSGATVTVVNSVQSDAASVVSVCATPTGTYAASFTTGALAAGALFPIYIQVAPSTQQTSGQTKNWNLRIT